MFRLVGQLCSFLIFSGVGFLVWCGNRRLEFAFAEEKYACRRNGGKGSGDGEKD